MGNKNSTNSSQVQSKPAGQTIRVPIKSLFSHSTKWRCSNPADFAYINKLRPKYLSNINLLNNKALNPDNKTKRDLRRVLIDAKRSSNLYIENSKLNRRQLESLLNSTNHLKRVKIYPAESGDLSKSLTRIGRNKNLSELTIYSLKDEIPHIHKQLKKLRKLESVDLNNEIFLSLQPLRSLKSFEIPFKQNSPVILHHLLSNLSKCDRLTELALNFEHFDSINIQETQIWTSFFQRQQGLKSLSLSRSFTVSQDYSGFQVFPSCLQFMKNLAALRVHLNISAERLDHGPVLFLDFLFDSLKYLPQLKKLEFTITGSYTVNDTHIKHLAEAIRRLKNLHSLYLDILHLDFSSGVIISLAKNLKNLSYLKHFKLNFAGNNQYLSHDAKTTFAKILTHLPLKSLYLSLSDQPILPGNINVPFVSALSSFKDLVSLRFDLSSYAYEKYKASALEKCKNLPFFSSLSVVVGHFHSADIYEGLSKSMRCLKRMPNLTTLKLSGKRILDQELDLFLKNLDGCPNLHRLELTFQDAGHLSGKALDSLQAALVKLTKLEYLEINLWRNHGFENDLVDKFLYGLIVLKRLKELVLNSEKSPGLFQLQIPALKESVLKLKNCRYLTKVEINRVRYL